MIQYDMHYGGTFSPQVRTEKTSNTGLEYLPYKFTAKELDEETGLYYYGARYLDPKYSMWISTDPALGEYIPQAPINDEAKKNNQNLPGMGGLFNHVNHNLYHYAGNNPVKYVDPDGRVSISFGFQTQAGAGVSGTVETGIKLAFSKKEGFSLGTYTTECIGAEFGVSAFAGVVIGASLSEQSVETGVTQSLVIGGSCEEIVGVGVDVSIDLDTKEIDFASSKGVKGASLKIGAGASATVGEVHILYSTTQQVSGKDIYKKNIAPKLEPLARKVNNFIKNMENQITNNCFKQMGDMYND